MTRTLDAAIAKLTALPAEEQERVGHWLLEELRDDDHWAGQFAGSQDALSKLADEARADLGEIERRARRVLANPDGGEEWSAVRAEIESKLRQP